MYFQRFYVPLSFSHVAPGNRHSSIFYVRILNAYRTRACVLVHICGTKKLGRKIPGSGVLCSPLSQDLRGAEWQKALRFLLDFNIFGTSWTNSCLHTGIPGALWRHLLSDETATNCKAVHTITCGLLK